MNDESSRGVHLSFWAVAVVGLIWNAMGAMNFVMQMDADMLSKYPESHRALIENRPIWATGGFAVAVFGGVLGCLLLLFRKSVAFHVFNASLLGVIVAMIHTFGSPIELSTFDIVLTILMPVVVAAFLIWYAKRARTRGWTS